MTELDSGVIGSPVDEFFEDEGLTHDVSRIATKKILATMLQEEMHRRGISQSAMAKQMHTSRAQIQRLLDPANESVTLATMQRAAQVLGKQVQVTLV